MKKIIILFISMFLIGNLLAQQLKNIPNSFKDHKEFIIKGIRYGAGYVHIPKDIQVSTGHIKKESEHLSYNTILFDIKDKKFSIGFLPGPSFDPEYIISVNYQGKILQKSIYAERLFLSIEGYIYADGKTDRYFDAKRKYYINKDGIHEVKQPYYLVNMTCEVNETLKLTSEPCSQGITIATITKGMKVHILLARSYEVNKEECKEGKLSFLVSTPFGLIGWATTKPGSPLSCIQFHGD